MAFLLLYVNDIVLTASSTQLLDRITASPRFEFAMATSTTSLASR
jgi:hypothetical protein